MYKGAEWFGNSIMIKPGDSWSVVLLPCSQLLTHLSSKSFVQAENIVLAVSTLCAEMVVVL